ncbi:MAG TPA: PP2C family protein-serine/threonine phosphatase, partial [Leptospiraceae bacterium]|nr:PP2C family protein-serine/threonine phosphatase [Leptospiraceae bacterium]
HNLEIFPYYSAMSEVGGDFYGVSIVSQNHYRIFLADVTGHGIQAALITMAVKGIYDDIRKFELSPSEILDIFNDEFFEKYQSLNSLLTCIFVDIYPNERKIQYASAGHPPCILLSEGEIHLLEKTGRMIGIKKANMYRTVEMPFSENDRILLFSDGIYEQFDSEGKEFGEDRLRELIQKTSNLRLKSSIEAVISDLNLFLGRQEKQDDITILGIELKKSEQDRQTD